MYFVRVVGLVVRTLAFFFSSFFFWCFFFGGGGGVNICISYQNAGGSQGISPSLNCGYIRSQYHALVSYFPIIPQQTVPAPPQIETPINGSTRYPAMGMYHGRPLPQRRAEKRLNE